MVTVDVSWFCVLSSVQALCINVQGSDVLETLSLVFCGADVNCSTDLADCPSPLALAQAHSQPLQAQFLSLAVVYFISVLMVSKESNNNN